MKSKSFKSKSSKKKSKSPNLHSNIKSTKKFTSLPIKDKKTSIKYNSLPKSFKYILSPKRNIHSSPPTPITSLPKTPKKQKPGVYYSMQISPHVKSIKKIGSLPLKLNGKTPIFQQKSFDEIFWMDYIPGMNIHDYVKKQIKRYKLEMGPIPTQKGTSCKLDKNQLKLFPYQIVDTVLGSPYSPLTRLLIIASTGTGKSCILVGIANYYVIHKRKHGIIFVSATDALYTNFIKQSMICPGKMKEIAASHGWTDYNNINHVQEFSTFMNKYIYSLDYTKFANMISGKYKKYQGIDSLEGKVILFDEAHILVDSMSEETCYPTFQNMPKNWQINLTHMYQSMSEPNNPSLNGTILIGATATPITQSMMEYFALLNLFARKPIPKTQLQRILKTVYKIEQGIEQESTLDACIKTIQPIIKESVAMYTTKTTKKVLDTSIFPQMEFKQVHVPLTAEQARMIYVPKNYIMQDF